MNNSLSDSNEIELLKRKDIHAVSDLIERMESKIYRYAINMIHDPELAKDIVQETFLGVFKGLDEFKMNSSIDTWVWAIAHGCVAKTCRRYQRKESHMISINQLGADFYYETNDTALENLVDQQKLLECIDSVLQEFETEDKEIIILRDMMGFTNNEVSKITGMPLAKLKSRLHRARLFLRERVVKKCNISR